MTKKEETILNNLVKTLQDYENECYRQMAYMNEHKFEMEREAIRYKQQAYNRSWKRMEARRAKVDETLRLCRIGKILTVQLNKQ